MEPQKRKKGNWAKRRAEAKKKRKTEDPDEVDAEDEDWELEKTVKENKLLEEYYRTQFRNLLTESEFPVLFEKMKEQLPITFRVIPTQLRYNVLCNLFSSKDFIAKVFEMSKHLVSPHEVAEQKKKDEPAEVPDYSGLNVPIRRWDFYPGNLLYEIAMSRHELKRSEGTLRQIHKFIQQCNEGGLINRQEVVSMLPPLILDVRPGMKVLDMCAAPGSKTSQLLEKCFGDYTQHHNLKSEVTKSGIVVANDSDYSRAFMLTHQLQRFDTASLLVLNHDGQNFPNLYYDKTHIKEGYDTRYQFDRILCDVPCSSDAAIRKIPLKWKEWGTGKAFGLHPLQLKLLIRALQLVRVGGMVCFSTCSLNPIEDEAVVHAVLKLYAPMIELVDVKDSLKGFKYRKGLTSWRVMIENENKDGFVEYKSYAEVPKTLHGKIRETMFYEDAKKLEEYNIDRCVRVLPHDQNTSGFFMALFRKVGELSAAKKPETAVPAEEIKTETTPIAAEPPKLSQAITVGQFTRIDPRDPESEYIKIFFGLDTFPMHLLYTIHGNMKTVILVTEAVNEFLELVAKHSSKDKVNITNMGVKCFERCKSQYKGTACLFRILQGAAKYLLPYMTKRAVKCSLDTLKLLFEKVFVGIDNIPDEAAKEEIKQMSIGSFLLYVEIEDPMNNDVVVKEPVVAHRADDKINILAGKQDIISLKIRLLFD